MKFNKIFFVLLLMFIVCELMWLYDEGIFFLVLFVLVCFVCIENDWLVFVYFFFMVQVLDIFVVNFILDVVVEFYKNGGFLEEFQFEED